MKPIAALAALAALLAADAASAAVHHAGSHAARLHRASRISHRQKVRLHATTVAVRVPAVAAPRIYRASDDDAGATSQPGFFKSEADREAGWGFDRGGMKTVVGLYQRPAEAGDIPGPQIYHTPEGRGAAGLSLSFKLGN